MSKCAEPAQLSVIGAEQDGRSMDFVAPEDMDEGAVMASTTHGVIQSINLADRTAQISGYIYDFGDPDDTSIEVY